MDNVLFRNVISRFRHMDNYDYSRRLGALSRRLEEFYYYKRKTTAQCALMVLEKFPDHTVHHTATELTMVAPGGETSTFLFGRLRFIARFDRGGGDHSTMMTERFRPISYLNVKSIQELRSMAFPQPRERDEGVG